MGDGDALVLEIEEVGGGGREEVTKKCTDAAVNLLLDLLLYDAALLYGHLTTT